MASPYENLEPRKFWRNGVTESHPLTVSDLYRKKFAIGASDRIATAGSCFAQHISNYLRANGFSIIDKEPPPPFLDDAKRKEYGYTLYSARYGNIYTVRQLLQLAEDAFAGAVDPADFWTKDGRIYDALRPNVEPQGFATLQEAIANRRYHLRKVRELFQEMTVFIFTLGLTEAWVSEKTGRVYPTAPGTIAGSFDPELHAFKNFRARHVLKDFIRFHDLVRERNPNLKIILTVSPVPLTATASNHHVLVATTYSKSVLRGVAGELAETYDNIDYFPSYEIVASPWSKGFFYESNMRSVNPGGVAAVMRVFFEQHGTAAPKGAAAERPQAGTAAERQAQRRALKQGKGLKPDEEAVCEEILLDAFAR
ncbi:MAG TPA: GSCFA domain-containing protein [Rhizomicrobium sp.]|jgi:hypothetical protein